jgi:formate hydrogenlyase subunit 6/NADH:ubiquinone oxidoreductase subunit I
MFETRRVVLDLLLARCPEAPLIQRLASEHGIEQTSYVPNPEPTDCIMCGLCTRVCDHIGVSAISSVNRGTGSEIAPPFHEPPPDCIGCLACAAICPTRALVRNEDTGAIDIVRERCISCRMCVAACPFGNMAAGTPKV